MSICLCFFSPAEQDASTSVSGENESRVDISTVKTSRGDAFVKNVESPNLLTFGLSKGALGKLGYRFKEDVTTSTKRDGMTSQKPVIVAATSNHHLEGKQASQSKGKPNKHITSATKKLLNVKIKCPSVKFYIWSLKIKITVTI